MNLISNGNTHFDCIGIYGGMALMARYKLLIFFGFCFLSGQAICQNQTNFSLFDSVMFAEILPPLQSDLVWKVERVGGFISAPNSNNMIRIYMRDSGSNYIASAIADNSGGVHSFQFEAASGYYFPVDSAVILQVSGGGNTKNITLTAIAVDRFPELSKLKIFINSFVFLLLILIAGKILRSFKVFTGNR